MDASFVHRVEAALSAERGVELAFLFGSRARGRESCGSDVDLAVRAPGVDLLDLARRLSLALDVEVDLTELDAVGYPMLREIVDGGVLVAERTPGSSARWRSRALCALDTDGLWYTRMRDAYLERAAQGR